MAAVFRARTSQKGHGVLLSTSQRGEQEAAASVPGDSNCHPLDKAVPADRAKWPLALGDERRSSLGGDTLGYVFCFNLYIHPVTSAATVRADIGQMWFFYFCHYFTFIHWNS